MAKQGDSRCLLGGVVQDIPRLEMVRERSRSEAPTNVPYYPIPLCVDGPSHLVRTRQPRLMSFMTREAVRRESGVRGGLGGVEVRQ